MTTAPNDSGTGWGSHQPALRALAKFMTIIDVVEFGAGPYSTSLFLDREAFPDLKSLISFEHSRKWAEAVTREDDRHTLIITPTTSFIKISTGLNADFVFVDSAPHGGRHELLEHALKIAPIVGFHDSKESNFVDSGCVYVRGFNSKIQTVFVSNTIDLSDLELL
ncbi:MAG: O-methyltransferase [Planctomycetota bacterium]|jgi:hypothetical protein